VLKEEKAETDDPTDNPVLRDKFIKVAGGQQLDDLLSPSFGIDRLPSLIEELEDAEAKCSGCGQGIVFADIMTFPMKTATCPTYEMWHACDKLIEDLRLKVSMLTAVKKSKDERAAKADQRKQ
jgi:hypothetical protein